jgi:hypothetical protein
MPIKSDRFEAILDTVWSIAASKYVGDYTIGYTARAGHERLKEHRRWEFRHLVILADKLTRTDASSLEMALQRRIREDKRHTLYRRYDPDRRDGGIYPSIGRANPETALLPIHSVYMAWRDR